jgi:transposase
MGEQRNKYTREFKIEAVGLLDTSGKSGHEIEADLGIGSGMIYRWRKQLEAEGAMPGIRAFPGNGKPRDAELAQLRKELAEVREERDILRKAVAIFSRTKR